MHEDDVFRFDIAMQYLMPMHQVDCLQQIADNVTGALFG